MELIALVIGVVALVMAFSLRRRVKRLELMVKGGAGKKVPESGKKEAAPTVPPREADKLVSALGYVKEQRGRGISDEVIKNALLKNGWREAVIDSAFRSLAAPRAAEGQMEKREAKSAGPSASERFAAWIKEDWLLKLGALLLLIGFGWLATYAFLNNWIGPMGRIALGIIAGALFILLGWWRIQKYLHQGGVFLVLGSTTILLTTFAARQVYDFFTPFSALAIMFLSTAFVALASVKYRHNIKKLD